MSKFNTTQATRLVNALANGQVTTAFAQRKLKIANPSAVISALRDAGYTIYTNARKTSGKTVYSYRLASKS